MTSVVQEPPRTEASAPTSEHSARRWPWVALVGLVLATAVLALPRTARVSQEVPLAFEGNASVVTLPSFDGTGMYAVGYEHGADTRITVPVRNEGLAPLRLTGLHLSDRNRPMLEVVAVDGLPVSLGPGEGAELDVHVRFDNCEYYTERAIDLYRSARLGYEVAGMPGELELSFEHPIGVRSPTMLRCEERVMDRSARRRNP